MHISKLVVTNIRSFKETHSLELSQGINILVGKNNSGKSTLLRALQLIQIGNSDLSHLPTMNRKGEQQCQIEIHFGSPDNRLEVYHSNLISHYQHQLTFTLNGGSRECKVVRQSDGAIRNASTGASLTPKEPYNLIVPYFSRRKVVQFEQKTDAESSFTVHDTLRNLYAKIGRLMNSDDETQGEFVGYCKSILGCRIGLSPALNGSEAGIWLSPTDYIPLSAMGEGTANILGLIVELCIASGKVFLIEELENDLHPEALKALLSLIISKSNSNQFIISTHSNIVVRHLGVVTGTRIYSLSMQFENKLPTTIVTPVTDSELSRQTVLKDLGYEAFDFGLWRGYLILEESSAEAIINRILIPHFVPALQGKLRTISAGGITSVEPALSDFQRLFVFTHTTEIYNRFAWVRVDGDTVGKDVIDGLQKKFSKVPRERFGYYSKYAFELYYPAKYQDASATALNAPTKAERRELKRKLCNEVLEWADKNPEDAKKMFSESASEIIADLIAIHRELN